MRGTIDTWSAAMDTPVEGSRMAAVILWVYESVKFDCLGCGSTHTVSVMLHRESGMPS